MVNEPSVFKLFGFDCSSFLNDLSKAISLLQFFVCASVVSDVAFVLSLFVPHLPLVPRGGLCFEFVAFPKHNRTSMARTSLGP